MSTHRRSPSLPDGGSCHQRPPNLAGHKSATEPTKACADRSNLPRSPSLFGSNCVLHLFDEAELLQNLGPWLESPPSGGRCSQYYLVFALAAQTCPEDKEDLTETCFRYGRYYTARSFTEDQSISTVQAMRSSLCTCSTPPDVRLHL